MRSKSLCVLVTARGKDKSALLASDFLVLNMAMPFLFELMHGPGLLLITQSQIGLHFEVVSPKRSKGILTVNSKSCGRFMGAVSRSDKVMCSGKVYRRLGSVMRRSKVQKVPTIQEACTIMRKR